MVVTWSAAEGFGVGYESAALFEHRFWLQIMGDHARFIKGTLSPDEREEIGRADCFIHNFDYLLAQARGSLNAQGIAILNQGALQKVQELRSFKLHLLERKLFGRLKSNMPPTFFNHMVNELEEFLKILIALQAGMVPPLPDPVHLHLLWLLDANGHAATISSDLDMVEKRLIKLSNQFAKQFEHFYLKAVEIAGYLRTHINQFPALARFNKQVELEMLLFVEFLNELEEMGLNAELLGSLTPLMAGHMAREECYYLTKLSMVSQVNRPQCDPTKPRTTEA